MGKFSIIICLILLCRQFTGFAQKSACGNPCKSVNDCPSKMVCNPNGICDDDPTSLTNSPPICPIQNCQPDSFVYTGPMIDQDHCSTNFTYLNYSCSPPIQKHRNFAILYYFDLVNEGIAKCDKRHYAGSKLVASIATGWFRNGESCFQDVRITASSGRTVVATVVDECVSTDGCTAALYYYPPCSPRSLGGTQAVWDALGHNISEGIISITWEFASLTSSSSPSSSSSSTVVIASSVAAGGAVLLLLLGIFVAWFVRRKRQQKLEILGDIKSLRPQQFKYGILHAATHGFQAESKLGEGGYGPVFEGLLPNGTRIAVKRVGRSSKQGLKQFKAEVMSIGSIHHLNLVKLLGFSIEEKSSLLLVYEYMPNGSLDKWIFDNSRFLRWSTRISIATDVARGLAYLHEGCRDKILHLDIKPQNILLDEKMSARICDFGFAKLVEKEKSHAVTVMRGTMGYMAPEWLQSRVTDKTDVYSFGILLLELICCRKNVDVAETVEFINHSSTLMMDTLVDKRLLELDDFNLAECERVLTIGICCIQQDPLSRPSMGVVAKLLQDIHVVELPQLINSVCNNSDQFQMSAVTISISEQGR